MLTPASSYGFPVDPIAKPHNDRAPYAAAQGTKANAPSLEIVRPRTVQHCPARMPPTSS